MTSRGHSVGSNNQADSAHTQACTASRCSHMTGSTSHFYQQAHIHSLGIIGMHTAAHCSNHHTTPKDTTTSCIGSTTFYKHTSFLHPATHHLNREPGHEPAYLLPIPSPWTSKSLYRIKHMPHDFWLLLALCAWTDVNSLLANTINCQDSASPVPGQAYSSDGQVAQSVRCSRRHRSLP